MRRFKLSGLRGYLRPFVTVIIVVIVIEVLVFNCLAIYLLWCLWGVLGSVSEIANSPGRSFSDKLSVSPTFQNFVSLAKDGYFVRILQETLERLYIEEAGARGPHLYSLGFDVSGGGEASYIYKRIQQQDGKDRRWKPLVVDIGSNDGFLSSNSFNFIQWGWSAVLVEPQSYQNILAERNLKRYIDPYGDGSQSVQIVEAVVGSRDGYERLLLSRDIVQMESRVLLDGEYVPETEGVKQVKSYSVKTLAEKYKIPKAFGILSIDAEGSSSNILQQWIELGFRPAYIIFEELHEGVERLETIQYLLKTGYVFLSKRSWNLLFEFKEYRDST